MFGKERIDALEARIRTLECLITAKADKHLKPDQVWGEPPLLADVVEALVDHLGVVIKVRPSLPPQVVLMPKRAYPLAFTASEMQKMKRRK